MLLKYDRLQKFCFLNKRSAKNYSMPSLEKGDFLGLQKLLALSESLGRGKH